MKAPALLSVGFADRFLESADAGETWTERERTFPPGTEPELLGLPEGARLPEPAGGQLTHVHVAPHGVGFAAGTSPVRGDRDTIARFWVMSEAAAPWRELRPALGCWGRFRAGASWPPEAVDFVSVLDDGTLAFAWDDPWLFEGPNSHLAFSTDGGERWRYARMPDACIVLAAGPGPLRAFGGSRFVERGPDGALRRVSLRVDGKPPAGYGPLDLFPRLVRFVSASEGFAVAVSWPREEPPRPLGVVAPPLATLLRTADGGRVWTLVRTWEGPRSRDLNRRHLVSLDVR